MLSSLFIVLYIHFATGSGLTDCLACSDEGTCSSTGSSSSYIVCASSCQITMPAGSYECVSGTLVPAPDTTGCASAQSSTGVPPTPTSTPATSAVSTTSSVIDWATIRQGATVFLDVPITTRTTILPGPTAMTGAHQAGAAEAQSVDDWGVKSYVKGGKMASVYDAYSTSTFRCSDVEYPEDGMYVAFWTPFNISLHSSGESQPAPMNCGDHIQLANPLTGYWSSAIVIDRCASCVGVGYSLSDPSTSDSLANGATVDLSRNLWNAIYHNAPDNVYDIDYKGKPLQGTQSTPIQL